MSQVDEVSAGSRGSASLVERAFNDLIAQINEANRAHAISYTALIIALLQKGIITPAEWDEAKAKATHMADQVFAEKRDEMDRKTMAGLMRLFGMSQAESATQPPSDH